MILALFSPHTGSHAPSVSHLVVNEDRIRSGRWLGLAQFTFLECLHSDGEGRVATVH